MGVDGTYTSNSTGPTYWNTNWDWLKDEPFAPSSATATANLRATNPLTYDELRETAAQLNKSPYSGSIPVNAWVSQDPASLTWDIKVDASNSPVQTAQFRAGVDRINKAISQYMGLPYQSTKKDEDMIDETQICKLDAMRKARNEVAEYLQAKHDRAALMRIQAAALEDEVAYGYGQINEEMPMPVDQPMADE